MMKKNCAIFALLLTLFSAGLSEETDGSRGQINQSLVRGEGWKRIVTDTAAFSLGKDIPYEADPALSIRDWGTYPSMDGSTVCVPMANEFARQWLGLSDEDLAGFVNFSTTPYAYERLTNRGAAMLSLIPSENAVLDDRHPVDLVLGTEPNRDEKAEAAAAGVELQMVPVCFDAFVFLVNGKNPVDTLTQRQIRDIYSAKPDDEQPRRYESDYYEAFPGTYVTREPVIMNWAEVGGEDRTILAYQRPHGSGSQTAMEELVMRDREIYTAREIEVVGGMSELVHRVGNYDNDEAAIGYSYLYYVNELYRSGEIKILSVDGIAPTPENLRSGVYPYTVCYYAVYEKGNETAARFAEWIVSKEGQACVAQAGYIPL